MVKWPWWDKTRVLYEIKLSMPAPSDPAKHAYMFMDDMKFLQKAILFHPTNSSKFLILRRSLKAYSNPWWRDLPWWNVCFPENHAEALAREIREETALQVTDIKTAYSFSEYSTEKKYYFLLIAFTVRAVADSVILSDEHTEYQWVTKEEYMTMEWAEFLKRIVDEIFSN